MFNQESLLFALVMILSVGCQEIKEVRVNGADPNVSLQCDDSLDPYIIDDSNWENYRAHDPSLISNGNDSDAIHSETVLMGDTAWYSVAIAQPDFIDCVELRQGYTGGYAMGDLTVFVSSDSTNGMDGSWTPIAWINHASPNYYNNAIKVPVKQEAKWVRFFSVYYGTGAHGVTPAFYISEVIIK